MPGSYSNFERGGSTCRPLVPTSELLPATRIRRLPRRTTAGKNDDVAVSDPMRQPGSKIALAYIPPCSSKSPTWWPRSFVECSVGHGFYPLFVPPMRSEVKTVSSQPAKRDEKKLLASQDSPVGGAGVDFGFSLTSFFPFVATSRALERLVSGSS